MQRIVDGDLVVAETFRQDDMALSVDLVLKNRELLAEDMPSDEDGLRAWFTEKDASMIDECFSVAMRGSEERVGVTGLLRFNLEERVGELLRPAIVNTVENMPWILEDSVLVMLAYGFREWGFKRIRYRVVEGDELMEKLTELFEFDVDGDPEQVTMSDGRTVTVTPKSISMAGFEALGEAPPIPKDAPRVGGSPM